MRRPTAPPAARPDSMRCAGRSWMKLLDDRRRALAADRAARDRVQGGRERGQSETVTASGHLREAGPAPERHIEPFIVRKRAGVGSDPLLSADRVTDVVDRRRAETTARRR